MGSSPLWITIFYFGEFIDEEGRWKWKKSEGDHGANVIGLPISSTMSYEDLHSEVQSLCNLDSSLHDVEMRFLLPDNRQFQVPIQITSNRHLQWLLGLNKQGQYIPICVTLVNKHPSEHVDEFERNVPSYEAEVKNDVSIHSKQQERDGHNSKMQENQVNEIAQGMDWNTLVIIPHTNVDISAHNDDVFPTTRQEFVQHSVEKDHFSSERLASSSNGCTSRIPVDFSLQQGQVYETKKDLQSDVHFLALRYNFEFKVKKSNKKVYTVVCVAEKCKWRLRATKFNQCNYFQIRKYDSEHTCSIAETHNAHRLYPLAWGIVDSENDDSWFWFFTNLEKLTGDREDLVIVSDRNQSLINAVASVYKSARHGHCIYHIKGNLRTKTRKSDTYSLFMRAAEAYTVEEFNNFMLQIQSTDDVGWIYLVDIDFEAWARSHFQGRRYNIMTSNNAESLNSLLKKERQGPILSLIERIGKKLQKWFHVRRENSQNCTTRLTPKMEEGLRKSLDKGKRLKAEPVDQMRYVVRNDTTNFIVNFEESSCTCRKFQLDSFPCEHAIAAARHKKYSVYLLCSDYYTTAFWRAAYDDVIFPAPNETEWVVTDDIEKLKVLPPDVRQQPGRSKKERAKSTGEFSKKKSCSRCGQTGHNRLTCRDPIPLAERQSQI